MLELNFLIYISNYMIDYFYGKYFHNYLIFIIILIYYSNLKKRGSTLIPVYLSFYSDSIITKKHLKKIERESQQL